MPPPSGKDSIRCLLARDDGFVVAGTEHGHWAQVNAADMSEYAWGHLGIDHPVLAVAEGPGQKIYFGTPVGIFRSSPLEYVGMQDYGHPTFSRIFPNPCRGHAEVSVSRGAAEVAVVNSLG